MSTPNESLSDEIVSINSIYDPETLTPLSTNIYTLRLPNLPSITLRLEFPPDYPDAPPSVLGTQSVGDDVQKGVGAQIVDIVRDVLANVYVPTVPCIFDLLEETREAVEKAEDEGRLVLQEGGGGGNGQAASPRENTTEAHESNEVHSQDASLLGPPPPWTVAPSITEKKSVFVARSAPVTSPAEAKSYVQHLLATDKKAAKATHNITAWRIRGPNDTSYQDCDDDGETAAGGRVLHLMQLMDVWDCMVVITRWYGGVHLGPDRFRIINSAAREALVLGGFAKEAGGKEGGKDEGKKKGKR